MEATLTLAAQVKSGGTQRQQGVGVFSGRIIGRTGSSGLATQFTENCCAFLCKNPLLCVLLYTDCSTMEKISSAPGASLFSHRDELPGTRTPTSSDQSEAQASDQPSLLAETRRVSRQERRRNKREKRKAKGKLKIQWNRDVWTPL